jgi:hypothetical protein
VSIKIKVRTTSETVVGDVEIQHQRQRARRVRKVGSQPNIPTMLLLLLLIDEARAKNKTYIYECRCDERLKPKGEESTYLAYTVLLGELEHLKIETRLINEKFASVMGECVI